MLVDLLKGFKKYHSQYGDRIILDTYKMKQGIYVCLDTTGIKKYLYISDGARETDFKGEDQTYYNWFRERDYNSILLSYNTNKFVADSKKRVHNNNFLTLFIKKKAILDCKGNLDKIGQNSINTHFKGIEGYFNEEKRAKKIENNNNPKQDILKVAPEVNVKLFETCKSTILGYLNEILYSKEVNNLKGLKDYIRIFYDTDITNYQTEYKRYCLRRIFNKNDYHIFKNGEVYGSASIESCTNLNKPSLMLNSMKMLVPFRVKFENAILYQKLYDFLYFYNPSKYNKITGEFEKYHSIFKTLYIPYDFDIEGKDITAYNNSTTATYYIKMGNKEGNIIDFDIIPPYNKKINFNFTNFIEIDIKSGKSPYRTIKFINQLENTIDYYFFSNALSNNYYEEKIDNNLISRNLIDLIYICRNSFYEWFRQGNPHDIRDNVDKFSKDILLQRILIIKTESELMKIGDIFNLRISLLKYFNLGDSSMIHTIKDTRETVKLNINAMNTYDLNNDEEFLYLTGQIIMYLLAKSESANKMQGMLQPFLQCSNVKAIKSRLIDIYKKYSYAIRLGDNRFNNAYSLIMGYRGNPNLKKNMDIFLAGLLSKNIMFDKKVKEKNNEREDIANE